MVLSVNSDDVFAIESKRDTPVPGHRHGMGAFAVA
jgi:hypothetical protein